MNARLAKVLTLNAACLGAYVGGLALAGTAATTLSVDVMQTVIGAIDPMRTAQWDQPRQRPATVSRSAQQDRMAFARVSVADGAWIK